MRKTGTGERAFTPTCSAYAFDALQEHGRPCCVADGPPADPVPSWCRRRRGPGADAGGEGRRTRFGQTVGMAGPDDASGDLAVTGSVSLPASALGWRFSRSSGPGGQGVNTADSRVELSVSPLEIPGSPSISSGAWPRAWATGWWTAS